MNRIQQILIGFLVIQGIIAALVFWPEAAPAVSGGPLLRDWDVAALTQLTIEDESGNRIQVEKRGAEWVVASASDFPATAGTAEALLAKFGEINSDRLVTRTPGSHARLEVATNDFMRRITVVDDAGNTQTFYLGSSQNARAVHVRVENDDNVYLTSAVNVWEAAATIGSWIDTRYIQLEQGALTAVTLTNENGTFPFTPTAGGGWGLSDLAATETANPQTINNLLFRLPGLRFARPLGLNAVPAYGLDSPQAIVTMTTSQGEFELRIGAEDENGDYYAAYSGSDYYVLLSASTVTDFVNWTRGDFLLDEPEG